VPEGHAWPGVAHDFADLLSHIGLEAMDGASSAGGFVITEPASIDALLRIGKKPRTPLTEDVLPLGVRVARAGAAVVPSAVHVNHHVERSLLSSQPS